jgi:S-(hydroxymethyl)glutathione dehydrogenase / alcohol dehydrogenase
MCRVNGLKDLFKMTTEQKTMKAAVLTEVGKPLVIMDNIIIPSLCRGQVLVKIAYAGLCRSQLMEAQGLRGEDRYLPHMLGHEGSGIVVSVGDGVTKVKPKDEVVLGWIKGEGLEAGGTKYQTSAGQIINAGHVTTFSEYAIISENRVVKKPKATPMDLALLYGCAIPTGAGVVLHSIKEQASLKPVTIAFFGLGGVGLSALMACKSCIFEKIIAVDISQDKLQLAEELGATHTVNAKNEDPVKAIHSLTHGQGVDFSIEAAGLVKTIEQAFLSVKNNGGRCIFISHPAAGHKIQLDPFDLICGKHIEATWGGGSRPDIDAPYFDRLYTDGLLPLDKLISKKYTLEGINQAMQDLESGNIARALITMG